MNIETNPEMRKTDEECFEEIKALLAEGWKFEGNKFEQDQNYRLVVSREQEDEEKEEKVFRTSRPYPEMIDSAGKARVTS